MRICRGKIGRLRRYYIARCGLRRARLRRAGGVRWNFRGRWARGWQGTRGARADYAEIVDAETFEPVVRVARRCYAVLAVYLGKTRLIDNMVIEPVEDE